MHSRAHCLSILVLKRATCLVPHPDIQFQLSGSPPISHSYTALPRPDSPPITLEYLLLFLSILTFRLATYLVALCHTLFVHSQTRCHLFLHYRTCLPNLALRPRAYIFLHALSSLLTCIFSGSLPMYSQTHCLCTLRLAAYVFLGSLPMYSQACCLSTHKLTSYVFSGSLPMYS